MQISIKPHKRWLDNEEALARRVAAVVVGIHALPERKTSGYEWSLHPGSNNWFMEKSREEGETDTYNIYFRYGGGGNAEFMTALQTVLQWLLGS